MAFDVLLIQSAEKDLNSAIEYYNKINTGLARKFYDEFLLVDSQLKTNPFFEIRYKNIRLLKLKSFPYLVHFFINEPLNQVVIIAIVFGKQERTNFQT